MSYNPLAMLILSGWIFTGVYALELLNRRLGERANGRKWLNLAALLLGPPMLLYLLLFAGNRREKTPGDAPDAASVRVRKSVRAAAEAGAGLFDRDGAPAQPLNRRADSVDALNFAAELMLRAVESNAARVAIRPNRDGEYDVFRRIDGVEEPVVHLDTMRGGAVLAALKNTAGIDPAERQGGRRGLLRVADGRNQLPCIVQTLNTGGGEQLVIRLKTLFSVPPLEGLGIPQPELASLRALLAGGRGLVLLLGLPGSGTTTTYYAILEAAELAGRNFVSIENPLELKLGNGRQAEVDPPAGKSVLKLLNQAINDGADTLAIGQLNDAESARLAVNSAKNGRLVIAVLDCATPLEAFARLEKWELTPRMLGGMPLCILSQALARRSGGGGMAAVFSMPDRSALESVLATRGVTLEMVRGSIGAKTGSDGLEEQLDTLVGNGEITRNEAARVIRAVMGKGE